MAWLAIQARSPSMHPHPLPTHDGPEPSGRSASGASTLSLPSPLGAAEDSFSSEGVFPRAGSVDPSMPLVDVVVDAVHVAIKPEWKPTKSNNSEPSAQPARMTGADLCVMRAIQAALQSPLECGDDEVTCAKADARLSEAVEALASIEDGTGPAKDGPWAQLINSITEKLLLWSSASTLHAVAEPMAAASGRGDRSPSPQHELVRELLSNTIWDYTGYFCDAVEEAGASSETTRRTLRRITELTTTWSRAKDINRLGIMAFIVSFACRCSDE